MALKAMVQQLIKKKQKTQGQKGKGAGKDTTTNAGAEAGAGKSGGKGKGKKKNPEWMTAPPTAAEKAAGNIKTVNGKTCHWCPTHEAWAFTNQQIAKA